jgi:hypothetical protein
MTALIYVKISLNSYWAKKFSGCTVFEENIVTRILYKHINFLIPGPLRDNCKKYDRARKAISYATHYVKKKMSLADRIINGKIQTCNKIFNTHFGNTSLNRDAIKRNFILHFTHIPCLINNYYSNDRKRKNELQFCSQ